MVSRYTTVLLVGLSMMIVVAVVPLQGQPVDTTNLSPYLESETDAAGWSDSEKYDAGGDSTSAPEYQPYSEKYGTNDGGSAQVEHHPYSDPYQSGEISLPGSGESDGEQPSAAGPSADKPNIETGTSFDGTLLEFFNSLLQRMAPGGLWHPGIKPGASGEFMSGDNEWDHAWTEEWDSIDMLPGEPDSPFSPGFSGSGLDESGIGAPSIPESETGDALPESELDKSISPSYPAEDTGKGDDGFDQWWKGGAGIEDPFPWSDEEPLDSVD